ncbi:ABC transporter substrate-binding protein [Streptomyces sp. N35]|uniref:peptide ABC transporter substrate-binding protein n=1 Tax=Streptomyces sp. N35 TaxID=2795730 RepID=UPI0018F5DF41|nr:ABC transporter substrate-binding protein [Streptomyces sp. N35]
MRGAKSAKWVAIATAVALGATACGGSDDGDSGNKGNKGGKPEGYVSIDVGQPQKPLIPADTNESNGSYVIQSLFTQLLDFDGEGNIVYTNAESVETTDSKTWTVKLKKGWKFHNGEDVTAKSYVDAWNWYANIKNNQQNAFWFQDIAGYDEVHPEKGDPKAETMSGLKVVDDHTFTIDLKSSIPYFNYKLGYATWAPLPKVFYDDPKAFGQKPIGNGPYTFEKWTPNKLIQVKANKDYQGPNKAKNAGVQFKAYTSLEAAYKDVLAGNLDMIRQVGPTDLPKYKQDLGDGAIEQPYAAIQTLTPAFYSKTFKDIDPKVLQGLSMAIDRETITKTVLNNTRTPAVGFVPPGVKGNQDLGTDVFKYDPKKAKQLVEEGGGVPGNKFTIQYNTDGGHKEWVTAVCESIRKATGVDCVGDAKADFATDLEARDNDQVKGMYRGGWVADYPVNANFMKELYHTTAEANNGRFSNKEIDEAMNKADNAKSLDESVKAFQEVEKQLVEHMPAIPLWYYRINGGHGKNVDNVVVDFHGDLEVWGVTTK